MQFWVIQTLNSLALGGLIFLLAAGFTDWSASAGWQRRGIGATSFDYGPLAGLGFVRRGLTPWLTGGLRVEAAGGGLFNGAGTSVTQ